MATVTLPSSSFRTSSYEQSDTKKHDRGNSGEQRGTDKDGVRHDSTRARRMRSTGDSPGQILGQTLYGCQRQQARFGQCSLVSQPCQGTADLGSGDGNGSLVDRLARRADGENAASSSACSVRNGVRTYGRRGGNRRRYRVGWQWRMGMCV